MEILVLCECLLISLILEVKLLKLKVKYDFCDMHYFMKYVKLLAKFFHFLLESFEIGHFRKLK